MATTDQSSIPIYFQRTLVPPHSIAVSALGSSRPSSRFASPASSPALTPTKSFADSTVASLKTFLPRTTLRKSPDHAGNMERLLFFRECFRRMEFWEESAILERMYYKNKSQHRHAGYFQRLCECRRLVSRIMELGMAGLMDDLVKNFYSGRSLKAAMSGNVQWDSIPYRSTVAFTMTRIIGSVLLLQKLQFALHETYGTFYQLMSKTQFMSFALIVIGLCSRLTVLSKAWTSELVDCYELLNTWIKLFPKEDTRSNSVDYEGQLPDSIHSLIAAKVPTIPKLPSPSMQPQYMEYVPVEGLDLGEVIQRAELPSALESSTARPQQRQNYPFSLKSEPGPDSSLENADLDDTHASLRGETDTISGKNSTTPSIIQSSKAKKTLSDLSDMDKIFGDKKKQKAKDKMKVKNIGDSAASPFQSAPSSSGPNSGLKGKANTGSTTNFDDIFSFDRQPSSARGATTTKLKKISKEIDDIFGTSKKPKKSTGSEILGGPPKKKKK
ncbi:hypothetical protein BC939DRAFT_453035 [Gamsiella multidivaricata]|uniref:uncharacterized protein n=1 Tax=Gamsiella multidivaricata TaxID=101098 RepID=UPI00221FEDB8|nr:uncharacterized protein BC939DRAFT_453035 [Gamsiella multidivaricata]KAG0370869.1 hypothetical protein BGZ54_003295 [Gamsiella multidivaricata]KAI7822927.1 hypothetical protein BC939DRAFT_453035 [Gamsiella multidivaricata]